MIYEKIHVNKSILFDIIFALHFGRKRPEQEYLSL